MLKENTVHEVEIIDLGHSGEGIAKIGGIPVFVEGVLIGDRVKIRLSKVKKNYGAAELIEMIHPSEDRVESVCPVVSSCGGCQIMQMDYRKQLDLKQKTLDECLRRIGGLEGVEPGSVIGMAEPFYYRNKSQYPIRKTGKEIEVGFFRKRSHDIVPITRCYIDAEGSEHLIRLVKDWVREQKISVYDEKEHRGNLRQIILRSAKGGDAFMLILVTREKKKLEAAALIEKIEKAFPDKGWTLIQNVNEDKTNVIMGKKNLTLRGEGFIEEELCRLHRDEKSEAYGREENSSPFVYRIYPSSFFQVNTAQTEILYSLTADFAAIESGDIVFDLYCGLGSISLFLAREAKKVYGIEIVKEAIDGAVQNAALNKIENAEFFAGKTEELLPRLLARGIRPDVVVLDPPRKGCEESVLQCILSVAPKRIVYVSCNPATLARDLKILTAEGLYRVEKVRPVDMFPHTVHVETVCLMSRKDK